MDTGTVGRALVVIGTVAVLTGGLLLLAGGLGLGRLPGDFRFGRGNVRVYLPLATSVVLSLVATIVLSIVLRR